MRVSAAVERDIGGLCALLERGDAALALVRLRALRQRLVAPKVTAALPGQLDLLAWRPHVALARVDVVPPAQAAFDCPHLGAPRPDGSRGRCLMMLGTCVARQQVSDLQRTRDTERGQAPEYPSCQTDRCATGRAIRALLDPQRKGWRGVGPGGRFLPMRSDLAQQEAARQRQAAAGLLEDVPTLDAPPPAVELEDDGEVSEQAESRAEERNRAPSGRDAATHRVQARTERESWRPAQRVQGVQGAGPRRGGSDGVRDAHVGDGGRHVRAGGREGGRGHAGLRVGAPNAGGRGEREGRRPARGV